MMAEDLDDGEFWLPPQFLSEDDLLTNCEKTNQKTNGGFEFHNSDLSSPTESVMGSNETESDEDESVAGLSRKLAQSTFFLDDLWKVNHGLDYEKMKSWGMATSPQSTLCNVMGGRCGRKQCSSCGTPNCHSPPVPPYEAAGGQQKADWELLHAAAEEVAKMKRLEDEADRGYFHGRGHYGIPQNRKHIKDPDNNNHGFHPKQFLPYHQLQAHQFQQHQMVKQQKGFVLNTNQAQQIAQNRVSNGGSNGCSLSLSPSAWPTLQQSQSQKQQNSGMRAIFLRNPVAKRECTGTGVFLPRHPRSSIETRKKTGCSTVLLPERVVQALNLNLEAVDTPSQLQTLPNNSGFYPKYDAAMKYRNNVVSARAQQRRNMSRPLPSNNEVQLPQEWTY